MTEEFFKSELLKKVSETELNQWLEKNPCPKYWKGGLYSWAYLEMPVGSFFSWFRQRTHVDKNII